MANELTTQLPLAFQAPLVDQDGRVTGVWYRFFLTLFQRTGGILPPVPIPSDFTSYVTMDSDDGVTPQNTLASSLAAATSPDPLPSTIAAALAVETPQDPFPQDIIAALIATNDVPVADPWAILNNNSPEPPSEDPWAVALAVATQQEPVVSSSGLLFAQTAAVTVGNTAVETTLLGAGAGSLDIYPNVLGVAGKTLKISAFGFHSAAGSPTIQIRAYLGSTVVLDTGVVTSGTSTNELWDIRAQITTVTAGVTGTVHAQGFYTESATLFGMVNTSTVTIDTTTTETFNLTVQWGTAAVGNTITMTNFLLELV